MWEVEPTDDYLKAHKWFSKNRPRELSAVLDNLDTVVLALKKGTNPTQIKYGFIHFEPKGIWAIDQKGGGKDLKQTRLYVYADERTESVHLLDLGDKGSQRQDIKRCKACVDILRSQTGNENEQTGEEIPERSADGEGAG